MFKKLFLILGLTLFPMVPVYSASLDFSYPSVLLTCKDLRALNVVFEIALTREPTISEINLSKCLRVQSFGAPIFVHVAANLVKISKTYTDWEGDLFAIFEYPPKSSYLVIYNPDALEGQIAN